MHIFHDSCCRIRHRLWSSCTESKLSHKNNVTSLYDGEKPSKTGTEHESSQDDSDCFCDSAERQSEIIAGLYELWL